MLTVVHTVNGKSVESNAREVMFSELNITSYRINGFNVSYAKFSYAFHFGK